MPESKTSKKLRKYQMWYKVNELFSKGLNKTQISLVVAFCDSFFPVYFVCRFFGLLSRQLTQEKAQNLCHRLRPPYLCVRNDEDRFACRRKKQGKKQNNKK